MDNESLKANTSFNVSSLLKERTLWLGKDKGYVVDDGTQTVAATLDRPSGIITHDGLRLMSQQGLPQKAKEFLSQSMDMSQVLFWGTAAGLNQSELTAIEIRDLGGLTFKKGKEAHIWESMQHKGFALSQKQGCLEGIAMPGAFQLESLSDPSVKKIILPAKQLSLIHPFDRADYFRTGSPIVAQPGYFEYDVIDKTGHLYSDDPLSLLYLTYVYQMIGDYTLANHYLNQLPQAHNYNNILNEMVKNPDKSPEASAFVCKLALRLIEEGKMGLDPSYVDQISPDFWKGVAEQFEQLTMYSHLDQAGLPTSLVMTNGEQKRLLIQLQKLKINLKAGLAAKAYQLENVTASRISQEVDLRDPIYSSIFAKTNHNNEYIPVAAKPLKEIKPDLSSSDFQNSFLFLFEKARRCEYETSYQLNELEAVKTKRKVGYHPFDLELQTLWIAAKNNPSSQHMVQVLYIVRHYPELFQHQEDFTFQEISSIAKKVMDSIQSIEGKKRVQSNISASKAKESSPKEKIKLQFSASQSTAEEKPCVDLVKTYFTSKTEPVFDQNRPFALAMGQAQSFLGYFTSKSQPVYQQSSLARRLYDKMTRAFQELQTNEKVDIFTPKGAGLEKAIQDGMKDLKIELEALKNQIEEVANTSTNGVDPALDHELLDAWRKGKTRISLQEVLLAVGTRNPALLTEHNPFLAQKEIDQLQHLAIAYMKKASKLDQLKEAAKAETPQDIATILNKTRLFDPLVWPELLFYEYSTGIMLRQNPIRLSC